MIANFWSANGSINQGLLIGTSTVSPYPVTLSSSGSNGGAFVFNTGGTTQMTIDYSGVEMPAPSRLTLAANGSTNGSAALWLNSQTDGPSYPWGITFATPNYLKARIQAISDDSIGSGDLAFLTGQALALNEQLRITSGGAVGIGTSVPCTSQNGPANCKLTVKGAIQAQEIVVSANLPDYVFAPGYQLTPLGDVAAYVKENHHLPGIPSAAEVEQSGIGVGEMQEKLLAKIEELTLHAIETEQRAERTERQNQELRDELHQVQERIALIEGRGARRKDEPR